MTTTVTNMMTVAIALNAAANPGIVIRPNSLGKKPCLFKLARPCVSADLSVANHVYGICLGISEQSALVVTGTTHYMGQHDDETHLHG